MTRITNNHTFITIENITHQFGQSEIVGMSLSIMVINTVVLFRSNILVFLDDADIVLNPIKICK